VEKRPRERKNNPVIFFIFIFTFLLLVGKSITQYAIISQKVNGNFLIEGVTITDVTMDY
jgi:hypothetical protein